MRKNIVYYVTRQYMKMNKKRTFTTFLGIVFMVLLMTCVFVGKDTAIDYMEQVGSLKEGKWHIGLYDITKKEREEVEKLAEVEKTAVSVNYGCTEFAQSANESRPYLNVKGYQEECFDWMNIKLKSGRLPENANEVVLSDAVMADGASITVGDTIKTEYFTRSITGINKEIAGTEFPRYNIYLEYGKTVDVPQDFPYYGKNNDFIVNRNFSGKKQELTVVGIMETPNYESSTAAGYTAITMLGEKEIKELDQFNISIILDLEKLSRSYESVFMEIAGEHEIDFNNYILAFSGQSSDSVINVLVFFLTVFFVVLIMFSSIILIYNVFNMSFEERSRYLGMLSSIGATGRQKRSSIYYEAFYLLIFALPAGILCGFGIIKLGMMAIRPFLGKMMMLEQYIENANVKLRISWEAIVAIVVISILTVLVSAYFPARKIGKIGSIECIRGNTEKKSRQYKMNRSMVKHGNAEGMLAGNTLKRQSKKTRAITAASVTFIVIMIVTAFGGSAITKAVEEKMGFYDISINLERDYVLTSNRREKYESLKQEIEQAEGIAETREWYEGMFVGYVPVDCYSKEYRKDLYEIYSLYYHKKLSDNEFNKMMRDDMSICVLGVDAETLKEVAKATGSDLKILENTDKPAAIVMQEGVLSTEKTGVAGMKPEKNRFYDVKQMTDKKVGESLPVEIYSEKEDNPISFPIQVAGYANNKQLKKFVSFNSQYLWLIVSVDTAKEIGRITQDSDGMEMMVPSLNIKTTEKNLEVLDKLSELTENDEDVIVCRTDYQESFRDAIIGIVYVLLSCFVVLTSAICMLNLFNSIRSRVNGRAREFAIMESVGMTKKQIEKMLLYENVGIVLKSILYAGVIAFPLMYVIQYGIIKIFGLIVLKLPWFLMVAAILITILVVAVLTKYCYRKEKHENIMERIRNENV